MESNKDNELVSDM